MSNDTCEGLFDKLTRLKGECAVCTPASDPAPVETVIDTAPEGEILSMQLSAPIEEPPVCIKCIDDDEEDLGPIPDVPCADAVAVDGTEADDTITLDNAGIVMAGAGDDLVTGSFCADTISGGEGDDLIDGGRGDDFLVGGAGADVVLGGAGNDTIIGGGGTAEDQLVTITFEGASSDQINSLGVYIIGPQGEIQSVRLAFENAQTAPDGGLEPGVTSFSFHVPPYAKIGTFLIADGFSLNGGYAGLGEGQFAFVDADGAPALVTDAAPNLVFIGADGTQTPIQGDVFHSAGFGDTVGLNADNAVHLRGLSENSDGTFSFGFEDTSGLGDADFNDLLFRIDMNKSGALFCAPDYDVRGEFVPSGDEGNFLFGGSGEDYIVTGDGGDFVRAGSGNDTIYAGPGDTIDGGSGNDVLVVKDPANFKSITITNTFINDLGRESYDGFISYKDTDEITSFVCIETIIPCFTPGTSIATPKGERLVEELREGDKIITRDNGLQEIRWIGKRPLDWAGLAANPHLKPVLIEKGALGNGLPERDILVSPQHRFLVVNERTQLYFDEHEVLVAAKHLVNNRQIRQIDSVGLTYVHFMCDRHQVVLANGAWTETFQPGDYTLGGMGNAQRLELYELFPDLATQKGREDYASARKTLKRHEARLIAS